LNFKRVIVSVLSIIFLNNLCAQRLLKGVVVEKDSLTSMPFVYLINKSNGNGTMTDNEGRFILSSNYNDTLICSFVGYAKLYLPVNKLIANKNGEVKIVMGKQYINLNTITVTSFKIKPYERNYMQSIIDRSKIQTLNYISNPISALYMQYSKEGKQVRKLAKIFEELFIEEEVQKKLSPEILRRLTGDDSIDYDVIDLVDSIGDCRLDEDCDCIFRADFSRDDVAIVLFIVCIHLVLCFCFSTYTM
jgi:hypothetical protein